LLATVAGKGWGQSAGINTTSPDQSAAFHVMETANKGLLIPSPSTRPAAEDGLLIYNTTNKRLEYANGSTWTSIVPVPSGTIIMWSGAADNIPDGWVICDGRRYNYRGEAINTGSSGVLTPNLKGRFIMGYSKPTDPITGGDKFVGLSAEHLPAHSHSISSTHNHSISVSGNHTHGFVVPDIEKDQGSFVDSTGYQGIAYTTAIQAKTASSVSTSVSVTANGTGVSLGATGTGTPHENRPSFYTVAFIMKL